MDAAQSLPLVRHQWALSLAFLVAGILVFPLDVRIATAFTGDRSRSMSEFLEVCEVFGHGFGATLILIAVVVLTPFQWRRLPWLIIGSLGSGMAANLVKLCIPRTRPRDFDLTSGTVWETFIRTQGDSHSMQSMPSSHTATAVGLAIVLATLYPRGRYYFLILALLVGFQRIATQAHFPSDVCAGAVVGCVVGICSASLLHPGPVTRPLPVSSD
jgi:membrane-associated phospholipid phosphatase